MLKSNINVFSSVEIRVWTTTFFNITGYYLHYLVSGNIFADMKWRTFFIHRNYRKHNMLNSIRHVHGEKSPSTYSGRQNSDLSSMVLTLRNAEKCTHWLFGVTKEVKLSVFQFKVIHNILSTNSYQSPIEKKTKNKNKTDAPSSPFCPNFEQTISHLFVLCPLPLSFWNEVNESHACHTLSGAEHGHNERFPPLLWRKR